MKKVICSLSLAAFVCASFVGCGGEAPKKEEKKASAPAPTPGKEVKK